MSQSRIDTLIFDVDGTLYRSGPVRTGILLQMMREALAHPREMLETFRALRAYRSALENLRESQCACPVAEQIRAACRNTSLPEATLTASVARWMEEAPLGLLGPARRAGLLDLLKLAKDRRMRIGAWSDYPAVRKLEAMGVLGYFDAVVSAQEAEVQRFKPDPKGLEVLLARLGAAKEGVLYLGDRPEVDGVAASRAGVRCLIVGRSGRHPWPCVSDLREVCRQLANPG